MRTCFFLPCLYGIIRRFVVFAYVSTCIYILTRLRQKRNLFSAFDYACLCPTYYFVHARRMHPALFLRAILSFSKRKIPLKQLWQCHLFQRECILLQCLIPLSRQDQSAQTFSFSFSSCRVCTRSSQSSASVTAYGEISHVAAPALAPAYRS